MSKYICIDCKVLIAKQPICKDATRTLWCEEHTFATIADDNTLEGV